MVNIVSPVSCYLRSSDAQFGTPYPRSAGFDTDNVQGTRPIHRLKAKELECGTVVEQALHVILWDADDDELEVLQLW